jgi:hypothetical protein|tara:strand:- start:7253 stop:7534 length:282 start_codon:yes stop_codon:yes gene_type:complete
MDWEVLFPALAFTVTGAFGIWASYDTNFLFPADTFIQGLHATSMFVLALGLMLLPGGLFKGGTPRPTGIGLAVVATLVTMTAALGIVFLVLNF